MSRGLVAIIPIRSLEGGKTRLASALSPETREWLVRRMLLGVIQAARESGAVAAIALVSPDPAALALAASLGPKVYAVPQPSDAPGLNAAIDAGRHWAEARGASGILVLFGDLPLLTAADVRNLVRRDAPVVLAPDRHGTGTNALLLRLDGLAAGHWFRFHYGDGSFAHHVDEAHRLGLEVATSISAGTALDLDTPDDLALVEWDDGPALSVRTARAGLAEGGQA